MCKSSVQQPHSELHNNTGNRSPLIDADIYRCNLQYNGLTTQCSADAPMATVRCIDCYEQRTYLDSIHIVLMLETTHLSSCRLLPPQHLRIPASYRRGCRTRSHRYHHVHGIQPSCKSDCCHCLQSQSVVRHSQLCSNVLCSLHCHHIQHGHAKSLSFNCPFCWSIALNISCCSASSLSLLCCSSTSRPFGWAK